MEGSLGANTTVGYKSPASSSSAPVPRDYESTGITTPQHPGQVPGNEAAPSEATPQTPSEATPQTPSEATPQKDSVIAEAAQIFQDQITSELDIPSFRTTEELTTSHFRFNFDNLLSAMHRAHAEYFDNTYQRANRGKTVTTEKYEADKAGGSIITETLDRCIKFARKLDDEKLTKLMYDMCMSVDCPKVAWWSSGTNDWIATIRPSQLTLASLFKKQQGVKPPPYLPIGSIYSEAVKMRMRCEEEDNAVEPEESIMSLKLAKHLYLCFLEAIRFQKKDKFTQGDVARVKQCERRLKIIYVTLQEAVGEEDDFLDVLISSIPGLKGPDGQELNARSVRKALGSVMKTNTIHELMTLIPKVLSSATDETSARSELMKQPLIKELMGTSKGQQNMDQIMSFFGNIGALPTDTANIPLNTNGESTAAPIKKKTGSAKATSSVRK